MVAQVAATTRQVNPFRQNEKAALPGGGAA
jgi:hypothetical protein